MKKIYRGNIKAKAMQKHFKQRFENTAKESIAASSITLPNWNAARVNAARKMLVKRNINISKTQILLACVKAYLPKLRVPNKNEPRHRTRRKNDGKYSYTKISTYCDFNVWDHLFQKCLHNKISISHVLDISVRLYLRSVLQSFFSKKVAPKLFHIGKYQKIIIIDKPTELKLLYIVHKPPS